MKRIRIYLHRKTDADLMTLKNHPTFSITKATRLAMEMAATGNFSYIGLPNDLGECDVFELPKRDSYEVSFADNDPVYKFFAENKGQKNERYVGLRSDFVKNLLRGVLTGPILSLYKDMDQRINPMFNSYEKQILVCVRNEKKNKDQYEQRMLMPPQPPVMQHPTPQQPYYQGYPMPPQGYMMPQQPYMQPVQQPYPQDMSAGTPAYMPQFMESPEKNVQQPAQQAVQEPVKPKAVSKPKETTKKEPVKSVSEPSKEETDDIYGFFDSLDE